MRWGVCAAFADDVTVDHGLVEVAVECIVRPAAEAVKQ